MANITKRLVEGLEASPDGRDLYLWDDALPGFGVRVKRSGATSYLVQYRNKTGVSRRYTLGRHGVLTTQEARDLAKDKLAAVRHGRDPAEEKADGLSDPTIAALCDLYLADGPAEKPHKRESSWDIDKSNINRHIKVLLGRKKLASVTSVDVAHFQRDVTKGKSAADEKTRPRGRAIVEGGPGTAARATAVLGAILSFAVRRRFRADNPARGVKLNALQKRERFLSTEEFGRLGDALAAAEDRAVNANGVAVLRLLMLTGARKNEICGLRWDWIDFQRKLILLPISKTGAKPIPLGAPALKVLSSIKRKGESPWVFPAAAGEGHYQGLARVWAKVAKAAKLSNVRLHDLRHSFASVSVAGGASLYILGKVLGHTQSRTTEKYAHLADDPVRALADSTAKTIASALQRPKKNRAKSVVSFPTRHRRA